MSIEQLPAGLTDDAATARQWLMTLMLTDVDIGRAIALRDTRATLMGRHPE